MSLASRVWGLRALARAELSPLERSRQFPEEFKHLNFDGMTEDEACITMESLAALRTVDKNTSKVFFDYLWGESKLPKLSVQNKLRACAGMRDFRMQHPKHHHIIDKLFRVLDERKALMDRNMFVDALLHCGQLGPLSLRQKHQVMTSVLDALEESLESLWALPRALQALGIHDEKIFSAFAERIRLEELSVKEMLEFVRGLLRWEVGPPGMKRCALTVFTDLHPPTVSTAYLWVRVLSRLKTTHVGQPFVDALMAQVPPLARRLNAEKLLLLANAISYNFAYSPHFAALEEEIRKQLPLEVYNFEDLAALFRASRHLKAPLLAAELLPRVLAAIPAKPHKAATKVLITAADWSKEDPSYIPLVDAMIPLTAPADRIQVLGAASDPAPIVDSVSDELCFLSKWDLRACSTAVRDEEAAKKIRDDFERRGLEAADVLYWLRTCQSVPDLMRPLVIKYRDGETTLGAACRDALYWDAMHR